MPRNDLSIGEARRIALAAQGFHRLRPSGQVDGRHLSSVIKKLGLIQIDFVNVVVPSHYLVLFSRIGAYDKTQLDQLVYCKRQFTEQWAHEASIVPMAMWPLLRHRRQAHRIRPKGFDAFLEKNSDYVLETLEHVRQRGPLSADELSVPEGVSRRLPESWFGTVPRAVLEAQLGRGLLAVALRREGFARVFDLAERIIPSEHYGRIVSREEAQRQLLLQAGRALGVGTASDLADYFRLKGRDVRARIGDLVASGELRLVRVENWREPAYLDPRARLPRQIKSSALLSPFDPVVWHRARAARLFDFDFRFEIFVPREKRRWGTYVLPFLLGDRLVACVDLKADRVGRHLLVIAAYREHHADSMVVVPELAKELTLLCRWLQLDTIVVKRKGDLARSLAKAFR